MENTVRVVLSNSGSASLVKYGETAEKEDEVVTIVPFLLPGIRKRSLADLLTGNSEEEQENQHYSFQFSDDEGEGDEEEEVDEEEGCTLVEESHVLTPCDGTGAWECQSVIPPETRDNKNYFDNFSSLMLSPSPSPPPSPLPSPLLNDWFFPGIDYDSPDTILTVEDIELESFEQIDSEHCVENEVHHFSRLSDISECSDIILAAQDENDEFDDDEVVCNMMNLSDSLCEDLCDDLVFNRDLHDVHDVQVINDDNDGSSPMVSQKRTNKGKRQLWDEEEGENSSFSSPYFIHDKRMRLEMPSLTLQIA